MTHYDGLCDHPETPYFREIWIRPDLKGERMIDVILHEILHAALPDLNEESVEETATDMAKILWELGYRNEDWD
jgi:hypothetical protein